MRKILSCIEDAERSKKEGEEAVKKMESNDSEKDSERWESPG